MKKVAFTIAFGSSKYMNMAKALEASIKRYSPNVDFKIFTEEDITPPEIALPKDRKLYPKDYKYPKIEIMSKLSDVDTKYMFIDADTFICGNLEHYFDLVSDNELMIEYVYNGNDGWAGLKHFQFSEECRKVGINNIEPYSINSGFIVWQGNQPCFQKALEYLHSLTIDDAKGRKGDEYYICAGIQSAGTNVVPIDYNEVKLGKFWNGKLLFDEDRLKCSAYPDNDRVIQHYGNNNYDNPAVQKLLKVYGFNSFSYKGYLKFLKKIIKAVLKQNLAQRVIRVNKFLSFLGYRLVKKNKYYRIEKNVFFDEIKVLRTLVPEKNAIIFDVGAHIGDSAQLYSSKFSQSVVHCFEPANDSYKKLQHRFDGSANVVVNNLALGNEKGEKKIYLLGENSTGNSFIPPNKDNPSNVDIVQISTIDEYCKTNGIKHLNFLKIDTQGYERECLEGAADMLKSKNIDVIKLEIMFHNTYKRRSSFLRIEELLQPLGYVLFDISWIKKSSHDNRILVVDAIYSKEENY